jgi:oxepin-CoA hydrolase/3-oxo-5,6-dehydrosuberyl-CoA semialdehyde dehydrogenase
MTRTVESLVAGRWQAPAEPGVALADAATGEPVASVSSAGIDVAAMVGHARAIGGAALRELTFHERALILKAVAIAMNDRRDDLYALSLRTGATRRDALIDIDGGIGVLFSYSGKGRRELPNAKLVLDGPPEPLSKGGSFVGQHVYTSRHGVAVQVNAFNFPVWGMLEKFAPAFLAGLPTIVKPATPTAYLAAAAVRQMVEAGLPEGSIQLLAGRADGLLDELGGDDLVAFTGSAETAARLRVHDAFVRRGTRFNVETDSLNAAILGPDAAPGEPEFDLFVKSLVAEMTSKAGQKCTAIRRAFVPRERIDDVVGAAEARLARVVVGNPADESVTMGALVSLEQRAEVRRALAELTAAGRLVLGDPDRFSVTGADAERGAFLPPLLLTADADRAEPHEVEAFGPVSTLLSYDGGAAEVVALAARGRGSLVGSIASYDRDFVREVVLGAAALHGRLLVLDRDDAKEQTGHGSPLPVLTHGGPGRAGGGEELGGVRSVFHHMQRTAIQGSPSAVAAITGVWTTGAATVEPDVHPFRKHLEDLVVGERITAGPRTVTDADIAHFAEFTGDTFYAHTDDAAAAANPFFGARVAHGYLVLAFAAGLFVDPAPGPVLANYGLERLRFVKPTFPGDSMTVALTVREIVVRTGVDYGEVRWDVVVTNQDDEAVATYELLTLVAKRPPA